MIDIDFSKCTGCGFCEKDCFTRNIIVRDRKAQLAHTRCIRCGHCIAVCPSNAIQITEYDMSEVDDVVAQNIAPEELLTFIKMRRSIRQYQSKAVPPELIKQMIEAGRFTPTASNLQNLTFVVVEKEMQTFRSLIIESLADLGATVLASEKTPALFKEYAQRWLEIETSYRKDPQQKDSLFFDAPVVILIAGDNPIDAGLAASNMELVACANGLGVLYSGFITSGTASEKVKDAMGIPSKKKVLVSFLVGYPDVRYQRTVPRKKADIVWR